MASRACVFCEIVAGRAPAHFVLEEAACVAFLWPRQKYGSDELAAAIAARVRAAVTPDGRGDAG
ncbi:MAG: hypothetical protein ABSE49_31100 [Polyangiaceae bacterium]|jgi:hypothetical protein